MSTSSSLSKLALRRLPVGALALALLSCDVGSASDDGTQRAEAQALALSGGALMVVGNATLVAGDSALRQRLQGLGLSVTVKTAVAVTAADATDKVVVISESVSSGDVNTKLRNVASPVVSLEPLLFDELGLTGSTSMDNGAVTGQTSVLLLAAPGTLAGNVTVAVTASAQSFGWGRPAATATVQAAVAGDPSRATIFYYERGAQMIGLAAPARRVGWFATVGAAAALNANGWSLFDAAITWAAAGVAQPCMATTDCPGTLCQANRCTNTCVVGKVPSAGACVDKVCAINSDCPGTVCQSGRCSSTCAPGKVLLNNACVDAGCVTNADCPGGFVCVANSCTVQTCAAGRLLCGSVCIDPQSDPGNCGACGTACGSGQICSMGACH